MNMRRLVILALALGMLSSLLIPSFHQTKAQQKQTATVTGSRQPAQDSVKPVDVERIIRAFTAKETQFRTALNNYAFKRDAVMQSIGMGGQIIGEYHRVSNFTFDDRGNRFERITFFPMPSFPNVTQEDLEDLGGVNQFALEASKIPLYNFAYVGTERIDELDLYVFDVAPKVMPDPKKVKERLFLGRIWVDQKDLQIVKTKGKGVPETKRNKYPIFETYREHIDGRYWFPTYAYADEELIFDEPNSLPLHVRAKITYTEYKMARGDVRIIEGDIIDDSETAPKPKPSPTPTPTKP